MANVPDLRIGGTGTSATQSAGAIPVVATGGKVFGFSAVGTSGYFARSGGTGVPTWFNLFGTTNSWTATQIFNSAQLQIRSDGSLNQCNLALHARDASLGTATGALGYLSSGATTLTLKNDSANGIMNLQTSAGNFYITNTAGFSPGAGGAASGVIAVQNAATVPTANPTGGAFWYVEAGATKMRGSSGTTTTVAAAEPHCPTCGRDYVLEWDNENGWGHHATCLPCLLDEVKRLLPQLDRTKFTVPRTERAAGQSVRP